MSSQNTYEDRNGKRKMKPLPEKEFEVRESLLTELFENSHIKTMKHIVLASLFGLFINTLLYDYFEKGEIILGLRTITQGFGKLHVVAAIWIVLNLFAILCYYCFNLWASIRIHFSPRAKHIKLYDTLWMLVLLAYYILHFYMVSVIVRYLEFPIASSAILCLEQTRLLMKTHAFVRSNINKVVNFKPHSDKDLELANVSHFLYFLFVPTLIYKDKYPRSKSIRWRFVIGLSFELIGVIFYYAFLVERFLNPSFKEFGQKPYKWSQIFMKMNELGGVAVLFLILAFYVVLHTTQNLVGELLRFGDRQFYRAWWTSTSYTEYFRTWNIVVSDWLFTYIYKDSIELLVPGNKTVAKLFVFAISALVHEWILTYMFGFLFPALFVVFFFSGSILSSIRTPKLGIFNVFFWYFLSVGCGILVSLYAIEYFIRQNVPFENPTFKDYIIPRLFTCECIF